MSSWWRFCSYSSNIQTTVCGWWEHMEAQFSWPSLCVPVGAIAPWWRRRRLHPGSSQRRAALRESRAGLRTTGQDPQRAVWGKTAGKGLNTDHHDVKSMIIKQNDYFEDLIKNSILLLLILYKNLFPTTARVWNRLHLETFIMISYFPK